MYDNILVPIAADHDPKLEEALAIARLLLSEGGRITVLTVIEHMPGFIRSQLPEGQMEETRAALEAGLKQDLAGAGDVDVKIVEGHSARTILDVATQVKAGMIVISSHRPDLTDYFLGSTAARVVRHAPCSVHVMR